MSRDEELKARWTKLVAKLSAQFADGDSLDLDAIIYLVGVQELGQLHRKFKKDHKLDLMHIAICRLLEPYGYYQFDYIDEEGWPHFYSEGGVAPSKSRRAEHFNEGGHCQLFLEAKYIN